MANSEIKHIDLSSLGTTGTGISIPGVKRKKGKDVKKSLGKVKLDKGKQSKGVTLKSRNIARSRR